MGEVDTEPMTDMFLTVVGAVTMEGGLRGKGDAGKTVLRIHGIAIQRVRECNCIKAVGDSLGTLRDYGYGYRLSVAAPWSQVQYLRYPSLGCPHTQRTPTTRKCCDASHSKRHAINDVCA